MTRYHELETIAGVVKTVKVTASSIYAYAPADYTNAWIVYADKLPTYTTLQKNLKKQGYTLLLHGTYVAQGLQYFAFKAANDVVVDVETKAEAKARRQAVVESIAKDRSAA